MSDLRRYALDVERDLEPPALVDLVEVARRRRRTRVVTVSAAVMAVAMIGMVMGAGGFLTPDRGAFPAERVTSPSTSPLRSDWTAQDVVGHPDAIVLYSIDAADSTYRLRSVPASDQDGRVTVWFRCSTGPSTPFISDCQDVGAPSSWSGTQGPRAGGALALEVSGSRGAPLLVSVGDLQFGGYSIEYVGDGRFFLNGEDVAGPDLLAGAGMAEPLPLTRGPEPVPLTPGVDQVLCADLAPCVLDVAAATVTPVDVPGLEDFDFTLWADSTDNGLWGLAAKKGEAPTIVLQDSPRGPLRELLPTAAWDIGLPIGVPAGVMAYFTNYSGGPSENPGLLGWHNMGIARFLHVSTDAGQTWRVLSVPPGIEGSLAPELYVTHLPVLPEGWETWPEVDR